MEQEDRAISAKIRRALAAAEEVSDLDIEVETIDGIAYLRGEVNADAEKRAATEVARTVPGVKEVRNQLAILTIRPPAREWEKIICRERERGTEESENAESS
ncbi:MAG: BON domain-containing protein [Chloroflexi bacterium]|nr:BON domain-containing protein [Chloroflexota bacterium]